MKDSLQAGLTYEFRYQVPENKTVPHLYPEAKEMSVMPQVFATGFLLGLIEWTCIQAMNPHLDWPNEQSVGIGMDLTHEAATPPGLEITVSVKAEAVEGRKVTFSFTAHDGVDRISRGTHQRFVIDAAKFNHNVDKKKSSI